MGKLEAPDGTHEALVAEGLTPLSLTSEHAAALGSLPWHHRDPVDRMLIAQAQVEGLVIASMDARFAGYEVGLV